MGALGSATTKHGRPAMTLARGAMLAQAAYYGLTGLWSWVSLRTFERVTGPKTDDWLVQTVGALTFAVAVSLGFASRRARPTRDAVVLAISTALAFAAVDILFVAGGRIRPIYLADAAVQAALIGLHIAGATIPTPRRR